MADIYGSFFNYKGVSSEEFDLIFVNVATERVTALSGTREGQTIFNKKSNKRFLIDDDMSKSSLTFELDIVRKDDQPIPLSQRRTIEKWLFNDRRYGKLTINDLSENECLSGEENPYSTAYLNCRFLNPTKIESSGNVIGYRVSVEADSDMFLLESVTKKIYLPDPNAGVANVYNLEIDTDSTDYTYPTVEVTIGSIGGDIGIVNNTDDSSRITSFINTTPNSKIIMNGEFNYINEPYYEIFKDTNFLRILDGSNNLTLIGNINEIDITYVPKRVF